VLKRGYGKKGEQLSIIGFGGINVMDEDQRDANDFVSEAIDRGINYFDVAPSYGNSEEKLGPALIGKRNSIFLACKTEKRTYKEAETALQESLKRLHTDHFDLYQLHAVTTAEDVDTILGPNGCMEVLVKAREKGLIRHIGFSAHSEEAALRLMDAFAFDSVLFPLNWANIFNNGFGVKILETAQKKGVDRLALKAMAKSVWEEGVERKYTKPWYEPLDDRELAGLALRYTLSQPVTAAIPPGDIRLFRMALEIAEDFKPITAEEIKILQERSKGLKTIFPQ
jgi:predicted aldo/keto reductase-like oxidoreductase